MKQTKLFFLVLMQLCYLGVHAQTCPVFTNLYSGDAQAFYGTISNPFAHEGLDYYGVNTPPNSTTRHTYIDVQGFDPNTGGALRFMPDDLTPVIRLGNSRVGGEAEAVRYTFTVNKDNALLLIRFAVVLEDPKHHFSQQPRFRVRVTDIDGKLTEECADYDVRAGEGIPGFQTYQKSSTLSVRWRDWTNMGIDLTKFSGKQVRVEFMTYDCSAMAHFGYCYFTASCMPNLFEFECGSSFKASAPEHFESYLWDNGDNTRTTTRTGVTAGDIWCKVTSATGCQFKMTATMFNGALPTIPDHISATICEGEPYTKNYFNLPPHTPGVYEHTHTLVNTTNCDKKTIVLTLNVIERYTYFKEAICEGDDYIDTVNKFTVIQPREGVFRDTVKTGENGDCNLYNVLELTVNTGFYLPTIVGEVAPCSNDLFIYCFTGREKLTFFEWEFPANAMVVKGNEHTPLVSLYFTDNTPGEIILFGKNGCDSGSVALNVAPQPSYEIFYHKTICQGEVFSDHGFNLGVQNIAGYFVYGKDILTVHGCDSSVTLTLQVLPTPVVRIAPQDPVLCHAGDFITLTAVTSDTVIMPEGDNVLFHHNNCDLSFKWNTGDNTQSITDDPTETTLYTVTATLGGCTATASQWVVVNTQNPEVIYDTICYGENYTKYDLHVINAIESDVYHKIIQKEGCDDIYLDVYLTVHQEVIPHNISKTVCSGERIIQDGFDITIYSDTLGIFRDTVHFISHTGCDSLVTFEITVNPTYSIFLRDTICQDQDEYKEYGFNEMLHNIAGEFNFTRSDSTVCKCDSIINLKLTVNPVITNIISDVIDAGETYDKYGFLFPNVKKDTTDTKDTISSLKCDSTVIVNLKVTCKVFPTLPANIDIEHGCENDLGFIKIKNRDPDYEYSIDSIVYRSDGNFLNLPEGAYFIYVRNILTGCEAVSTEKIVIVCDCITPTPPKLKNRD